MTDFTPKQIRVYGADYQKSSALVGMGNKLLNQLKLSMRYTGAVIAGPVIYDAGDFIIMVKSCTGVKDFIDVISKVGGGEEKQVMKIYRDAMLLFWGFGYERLGIKYTDESIESEKFFQPGEVSCSTGGGTVSYVTADALIGLYIRCWSDEGVTSMVFDNQGAMAYMISCRREWFADTYNVREVLARMNYSTIMEEKAASPSDEIYIGCKMNAGNKAFSKTIGPLTVEAFEYGNMTYSLSWVLCAKYNGKSVVFPDGAIMFTKVDFIRTLLYFKGIYVHLKTCEMLFDCWEEGESLFMGACGQDSMQVWEVNERGEAILEFSRELVGKEFDGIMPPNYRPYVCGYAQRTAFIDRGGYGIVLETCSQSGGNIISGTNGDSASILKTIWNHLNDKLYCWVNESDYIEEPDVYSGFTVGTCWSSGYIGGSWCGCGTCGGINSCELWNPPQPCPSLKPISSTVSHTYDSPNGSITVTTPIEYGFIWGTSVDRYYNTHFTNHITRKTSKSYGSYSITEMGIGGGQGLYVRFDNGISTLLTGSYFSYTNTQGLAEYSGMLKCQCTDSRATWDLLDWNITLNGVAYRVKGEKFGTCSSEECDNTNIFPKSYKQDVDYLRFDEWEAFLKSGVDANGKALAKRCVIYRDPQTDELFMDGAGNFLELVGEGDRAFFQYVADFIEEEEVEV